MKLVIDSWHSEPSKRYLWEDAKTEKIEKFVTDIVVELIVSGERRYREAAQHRYEWMLECRAELIEEARRKKEEEERQERERIARSEQERVGRLLADAQASQARDIRAYVREVTELCAEGSEQGSPTALQEWQQWALAQAERIDPVASGRFRDGLKDPGE